MPKPLILLAEDREDDIALIQRAFKEASIHYPMYVVRDGEEATAYLNGEEPYAERDKFPLPVLMLLDLKMPRKNGFEVLEWIRQQPHLRTLRVIVLTASDQIKDVNRAYSLGANSFLVKPMDFDHFRELGEFINQYWLSLDKAPTNASQTAQRVLR